MGAVQRIFYMHVGLAMSSYVMVGVLFVGSVMYLVSEKAQWDVVSNASASVSFLFCTAVLVSGMIWGNSAWNTFWRWEPRLVSFLVLWLILGSYLLLRVFSDPDQRQKRQAAVLGIIASINIPIVIFSVKLLDHREQLHPQIIANQGLRDASFVYTLVVAVVAMIACAAWFHILKMNNLILKAEVDNAYIKHARRSQVNA